MLRRLSSGLGTALLVASFSIPAVASTYCRATGTITQASANCGRPCPHCKKKPKEEPVLSSDCCVLLPAPVRLPAEPTGRHARAEVPPALPVSFVSAEPVCHAPPMLRMVGATHDPPSTPLNRPLLR